jgi:hypothetical protein
MVDDDTAQIVKHTACVNMFSGVDNSTAYRSPSKDETRIRQYKWRLDLMWISLRPTL